MHSKTSYNRYNATPELTLNNDRIMIRRLSFLITGCLILTSLLTPDLSGAHAGAQTPPIPTASFSRTDNWSCGNFPCEGDIDGFLQRIRVPRGFSLAHVGRFPGQVNQITYGPDGRLYATVLEAGTRSGAVYAMFEDGASVRYSPTLLSPNGLAFQPGTDILYVSARTTLETGGALWRIQPDGSAQIVRDDLPCCYQIIGNQPNGLLFGQDGWLYMGIGATTDHAETDSELQPYAAPRADEAAILRIDPQTGEIEQYASGIRNPFDLAMTSDGQLYATDTGVVTGPGDRLLRIEAGANYGWPFYRLRGCTDCPASRGTESTQSDLVTFPDFSLPRGMVAYTADQFPASMFDTLFIALWNGTDTAQRIVWIDPEDPRLTNPDPENPYTPHPFVTGLIRPIDVTLSPDGALLVADSVYGHIWEVRYIGETAPASIEPETTAPADTDPPDLNTVIVTQPAPATATPGSPAATSTTAGPSLFMTNTPDG